MNKNNTRESCTRIDKPKISEDRSILDKAEKSSLKDQPDLNQVNKNPQNKLPSKNSKINLDFSPFVKSFTNGNTIPTEYDYKKDYQVYQEGKY